MVTKFMNNKFFGLLIVSFLFSSPAFAGKAGRSSPWGDALDRIKQTLEDLVDREKPGKASPITSAMGPDGIVKYNKDNILEHMGTSFTRKAKEGKYDNLFCPDNLMNEIKMKLMSPSLKNVMMKAPAGVGKTTMAECFSRTIAEFSKESAQSFREKLKRENKALVEQVAKTEMDFADQEITRIATDLQQKQQAFAKLGAKKQGQKEGKDLLAEIDNLKKKQLDLDAHKKRFATEEDVFKYLTEHSEDMLESWRKHEVYAFNFADIMGGTTYRGQLEEKLKALRERLESDGNIIAFFDEAHLMAKGAGSTSSGGADPANVLKDMMTDGRVKMIFATTDTEFDKFFGHDQALLRRFHYVNIPEPSPEQVFTILKAKKESYEQAYGILLDDEALQAAIHLAKDYSELALPGSVFKVLDVASARKAFVGINDRNLSDLLTQLRDMASKRNDPKFNKELFASIYAKFKSINDFFIKQKPLSAAIRNKQDEMLSVQKQLKDLRGEETFDAMKDQELSKKLIELKDEIDDLMQQRQQMVGEYLRENKPLLARNQESDYLSIGTLTRRDIEQSIALENGIDPEVLHMSVEESKKAFDSRMAQMFPNQNEALRAIKASEANRFHSLTRKKPMVYFSVGNEYAVEPLAKILKKTRTGKEDILEIDLSQPTNSVYSLFGHTSATASADAGIITKAIRDNPHQVILLRNVERVKDPQILELLNEVIDRGRLEISIYTNPTRVNFQHSTFILHSETFGMGQDALTEVAQKEGSMQKLALHNQLDSLAAESQKDFMRGQAGEAIYKSLKSLVKKSDGTIVWSDLKVDDFLEIAKAPLDRIVKDFEVRGINLKIDDKARQVLIDKLNQYNNDLDWLDTVVNDNIIHRLTDMFGNGQAVRGNSVQVSAKNGEITIQVAK